MFFITNVYANNAPIEQSIEKLKLELNSDNPDREIVSLLIETILISDPSKANLIISFSSANSETTIASSIFNTVSKLKITNPEGAKTVQTSLANAPPSFQVSYINISGNVPNITGSIANNVTGTVQTSKQITDNNINIIGTTTTSTFNSSLASDN